MNNWQPISSAPHDGTLLLLLCKDGVQIDDESNQVEGGTLWRTIGYNSLEHTGVDEWEMAGRWNDRFTEGHGVPTHWMRLPDVPAQHAKPVDVDAKTA